MTRRGTAWAAVVLGVIGLSATAGALLCLRDALDSRSAEHALANARPCAAGAKWGDDCLFELSGTVTGGTFTGYDDGKTRRRLDFATPIGPRSVHFEHSSTVYRNARTGEPTVLTGWRGHIEAVTADGVRVSTDATPDLSVRARSISVSALAALMAATLPAACVLGIRAARTPGTQPRRRGTAIAVAGVFGGLALGANTILYAVGISIRTDLIIAPLLLIAGLATGAVLALPPTARHIADAAVPAPGQE